MNSLAKWTSAVCAELGIDQADVDATVALGLARQVARSVSRPAAPLTAFLLGMAVGRGWRPDEAVARLSKLVELWPEPDWRD